MRYRLLEALNDDATRDRLFSLGELMDYGPRSSDALAWIRTRFAATLRGNHESMMLNRSRTRVIVPAPNVATHWFVHVVFSGLSV